MKLSTATNKYATWKQERGIRYVKGTELLKSLRRRTGDVQLAEISPETILRFLNASKMAPDTWWRIYQMLRAFFQFWVSRGKLKRLPMPRPRAAIPPPFRPYIFTKFELRNLLSAIEADRTHRTFSRETFKCMVLFLYGTGALIHETADAKVSDIDFDRLSVTLRRVQRGVKRTVPISTGMRTLLLNYVRVTASVRKADDSLFVANDGSSVGRVNLAYNFKQRCLKSGIRQQQRVSITPGLHDLRHTFAVHTLEAWVKRGKDINRMLPVLSGYMGHVMGRSTELYLRLVPGRFREPLSKLAPMRSLIRATAPLKREIA